MASPSLHDCAICDNKTTKRCGGCRLVYFCSRECQELLWPTHKVQCGRDPTRFHLPALEQDEARALAQIQHLQFHEDDMESPMGTPMEYLEKKDLYCGTWPELVSTLSLDQSCPIPEPKRSKILIALRRHLGEHFESAHTFHTVNSFAYLGLSIRYTGLEEDLPQLFRADPFVSALPWFQEALVYCTLKAHDLLTYPRPLIVTPHLLLKHKYKLFEEDLRLLLAD
ncbi:hypothetical protein JCM5296_001988 [Sporobolomyces johnsonii]